MISSRSAVLLPPLEADAIRQAGFGEEELVALGR